MRRCWGVTRTLNRCNRRGNWALFCDEHKKQPLLWISFIVFTVIAGAVSIYSAFNTASNDPFGAPIPFNTGWIFIGYYNYEENIYVEGPFADIMFRPGKDRSHSDTPDIGDILRIRKPREIVIGKYKTSGLKHQMVSPALVKGILTDEDYTGIELKPDTLVIVRDIEISSFPGRIPSIWCRIANCDIYTESCQQARKLLD
jgi:hypothetical protein